MQCPRCPGTDLVAGADLSASTCGRCGGGLVPDDGAQRLLADELGHDRAALRELADLVGGVRIACASCGARMSPIRLRGALLDLCFQCGAVWFDAGELERVSAGRHRFPAARAPSAAPAVAAHVPLLRIDERPWWVRRARDLSWTFGLFGVGGACVGSHWTPTLVLALPALALAYALSGPRTIELLPRTGRLRRVRGRLMASSQSDEELPADAVVLAVPWGGRIGARLFRLLLVDGEGRVVVVLDPMVRPVYIASMADWHARALGRPLRVEPPRAKEPLDDVETALVDDNRLSLEVDDAAPTGQQRLRLNTAQGTKIGAARNAMVLRKEARTFSELLAADWTIADADARVLVRMLPSQRYGQHASLLFGADGALLGHVLVRRTMFSDVIEWASPERRRVARVRVPHGMSAAQLRDARGTPRGVMRLARRPGAPARVELHYDVSAYPGSTRLGVLALMVHASLLASVVEL